MLACIGLVSKMYINANSFSCIGVVTKKLDSRLKCVPNALRDMTMDKRRDFTDQFKAKVILKALQTCPKWWGQFTQGRMSIMVIIFFKNYVANILTFGNQNLVAFWTIEELDSLFFS